MSIRIFKWVKSNAKGLRKVVSKLPINQINVETISATKTLVYTDKLNQHLTPLASSRDVVMPSLSIEAGDYFIIKNCSAYDSAFSLIVKQSTDIIDIIYSNGVKTFIYNGTNWVSNELSSGGNLVAKENSALGARAGAYNGGVALGYDSLSSVVNGFAKGNYSETYRYGEEVRFRSSDGKTVHSYCMYYGESQHDTNYAEIFLDGSAIQWKMWDVEDSSVNFSIKATAHNCIGVNIYTGAINIIGHIRKGGNTTELMYELSTTLYADGTLHAKVEGDDTNDSLKLLVRGIGAGGGKIYWSAVIEAIEYRCPS